MKIVFVHTDFLLYWPKRLFYLDVFLKNCGHSLSVVEFSRQGTNYYFYQDKDPMSVLDWHTLFPDKSVAAIDKRELRTKLFDILDTLKPDVIFAGAIAFSSGALSIQYSIARHVPVVIFDNARLEDVPRSPHINLVKRCIYRNVHAVFCPSPALIRTFRYFGFREDQLFYGLNVVDNHFFSVRKNGILQRQETYSGLPEKYFLGVGRQEPRKNWATLVRAFAEFNRRNPGNPFHLVLVGDGSEHSRLEHLAGEKVRFFPFQNRIDLCTFYANAAAFILPSRYGETWGLVVNEAMASSLPVIVSNQCGCTSTLVKEGKNGWSFDPGDMKSLASWLEQMAAMSDQDRTAMGCQSFHLVSDWGLERFCQGAWNAIVYVTLHPRKRAMPLCRLISRLWYGRYHVA